MGLCAQRAAVGEQELWTTCQGMFLYKDAFLWTCSSDNNTCVLTHTEAQQPGRSHPSQETCDAF